MTDQDFLSDLQYALLEPVDGGASWASEVWSRDDVLQAVSDACVAVVRDTHCNVAYLEQFVAAGDLSVGLPADWLATAYLVWRSMVNNARWPLAAVDSLEADGMLPGWEGIAGTPIAFADRDTGTLELRLVPTPAVHGTLENLYIPTPDAVEGANEELPVPDLVTSAVKYRSLSTLLGGVHRLQDPERTAYCHERYQIAVAATNILLAGGA